MIGNPVATDQKNPADAVPEEDNKKGRRGSKLNDQEQDGEEDLLHVHTATRGTQSERRWQMLLGALFRIQGYTLHLVALAYLLPWFPT